MLTNTGRVLLTRYLRDWAFEGLVRVATNGRLAELSFYASSGLECRVRSLGVACLFALLQTPARFEADAAPARRTSLPTQAC